MPRTSAVNMKCPRSEHAGSRVKLDGTYGKPGHRRQRYTCLPGGGGKPHMFTELLPREESWHSSCEHCERQLERREGPNAPRHYQFVARGIAEALQAVGAGSTYMRASRVTRDRARRFRCDTETGELRESSHGQLLAGWVEVFAPVVFQPWTPVGGESPPARWLSMSSAASALSRASPSSGSQRRSQAPILPTGAPSWARCPAIPSALSVMVTAACSLLSRHAGQRQSCTSANGIYSMRSIACWPRRQEATPTAICTRFGNMPRARSSAPPRGIALSAQPKRPRTRASIAGSLSIKGRSRLSLPAGH